MIEGSGSGSIPLTNKSVFGSRRLKNMLTLWIRIRIDIFLKFISTYKELPCREVTLFICPCPVAGGCGQTQAETKGKYLLFLK
jgi:hypothetical protein